MTLSLCRYPYTEFHHLCLFSLLMSRFYSVIQNGQAVNSLSFHVLVVWTLIIRLGEQAYCTIYEKNQITRLLDSADSVVFLPKNKSAYLILQLYTLWYYLFYHDNDNFHNTCVNIIYFLKTLNLQFRLFLEDLRVSTDQRVFAFPLTYPTKTALMKNVPGHLYSGCCYAPFCRCPWLTGNRTTSFPSFSSGYRESAFLSRYLWILDSLPVGRENNWRTCL